MERTAKRMDMLPPEECGALLTWYAKQFPRNKRLPVQEKPYNLLSRRAKGK